MFTCDQFDGGLNLTGVKFFMSRILRRTVILRWQREGFYVKYSIFNSIAFTNKNIYFPFFAIFIIFF